MTNHDLGIHIRLALHDLGRDTAIRLPRTKRELEDMLKSLRQAQYDMKHRESAANQGLVKVCVWVPHDSRDAIRKEARSMRKYDRLATKARDRMQDILNSAGK